MLLLIAPHILCFLVPRETIVQLQHENKMLCAQEASYRLHQDELQGLLEESNRTKYQLEAQQRYLICPEVFWLGFPIC